MRTWCERRGTGRRPTGVYPPELVMIQGIVKGLGRTGRGVGESRGGCRGRESNTLSI